MKIKDKIQELLYQNAEDFEMAKALKADIATYFTTLDETFSTSGGKDFLVKHTRKIDEILKLIYKIALYGMFKNYQPMKNTLPLSMAALGSYGREQLCVHSDIDLLIVYRDMPGYNTKEIIEKIFYLIWDCGLKLGHRVHEVDELLEASRSDITIKTAIIESRFVEGSHQMWTETQNVLSMIRHDDPQSFVKKRLEEQHKLHKKFPFGMEPNLKEGRGGFRDANLVYWIGRVRYNIDHISQLPESIVSESEYKSFRQALEFLFRVRSALHLASGKKEDKLRLDLIPDVAKYLGYDNNKKSHMKFSQKVSASLKIVYLNTTIWIDLLSKEYDISEDGLLDAFEDDDRSDMKYYIKSLISNASSEYKASPALLKQLSQAKMPKKIDKNYYPIIRKIFQQPHSFSILVTLLRARVLKRIIPPLKKVMDLPQFDGYHQFPVDIHLLASIYHLEHISDPFIKGLFDSLSSRDREMIKLVTLLHDSGKGRKQEHSIVGATLYKIFAKSLSYTEEMVESGVLLIRNHTLMSNVAQREDLYSEKVIMKFSSQFKTKRMLDLIYILTYADMNGVGDDIYNTFTARLLKTLYNQAVESLEHSEMLDETAMRVKKEKSLQRFKPFNELSRIEQKKILSIPSNLLFLHYTREEILKIATEAWRVDDYHYTISNNYFLTIEITSKINCNLGYILGKLSAFNLVNMDICKLSDEYKFFKLDFKERFQDDELPQVASYIERSFITDEALSIGDIEVNRDDIYIDCDHSKNYALMKLNTKDQRGLIALLITIFDSMDIDIATAKIHTQKKTTRDLFLLEKDGNFCHNREIVVEKITQNRQIS
ncbi:Possible nucleotidyltransferase [hydrothermal vent metagenome]|uniref:Possible nucleotidyltransferase n=1 Tax=hydrothermal vent metagenome TaxID=652676 RepID=A0A1W1C819_9ZZZZ